MRYLLHESDHPISTDYYYECRKTTNDHFPRVLHTRTIIMKFISISVALLCCLLKTVFIK